MISKIMKGDCVDVCVRSFESFKKKYMCINNIVGHSSIQQYNTLGKACPSVLPYRPQLRIALIHFTLIIIYGRVFASLDKNK